VRDTTEPPAAARPRPDAPESRATNPLALRALAHPLRWKLIDLLGSEGSATATRCAEVLGESVASCSYHLGILAKYDYIELLPDQRGREKPWRLTSSQQILDAEGLGLEGQLAVEAATEVFLDHELARMKDRLRRGGLEPAEWREASCLLGASNWLTAAELTEIKGDLQAIADRYAERIDDPNLRPEAAREVRIFFSTSVAPSRQRS
jgi:DNA-binding MarR family transcriptional regulator